MTPGSPQPHTNEACPQLMGTLQMCTWWVERGEEIHGGGGETDIDRRRERHTETERQWHLLFSGDSRGQPLTSSFLSQAIASSML